MLDLIARCMAAYGGPVSDWLDTPLPLMSALAAKSIELQAERDRTQHYGVMAANGRGIADGPYREWLGRLDTTIRGKPAAPTSFAAARTAAMRLGLV